MLRTFLTEKLHMPPRDKSKVPVEPGFGKLEAQSCPPLLVIKSFFSVDNLWGFQTLIMACQMSYYTSCHLSYVFYQSRISFGSWVCQNHVQTYLYIEIFNQKNYISDKRTHVCRAFSTTPALVEIP